VSPLRAVDGLALAKVLPKGHFGTVFMSNYLEPTSPPATKSSEQFRVAADLLRPGGRVVGPTAQHQTRWTGLLGLLDHKVALTERSLVEAAETAGLTDGAVVVSFLPYTTKSRIPQHPILVRSYLHLRLAWRLLGGQTLYVGRRP